MATLQQQLRRATQRLRKHHTRRTSALLGCPQRRGVVSRIVYESPKKPNSARRRVARVRLCTGKHIRAKVPGPGAGNLQKFSAVLVRGAHPRDCPGLRTVLIAGKLGFGPVLTRRRRRSKYGIKKRMLSRGE